MVVGGSGGWGAGGYLQLQAAACTLVNCNEMFAESSLFVAARLDDAAPLPPPTIIFFYMQKSPPFPPAPHRRCWCVNRLTRAIGTVE